ncbi:MAG: HD domain-containing protein [Thermoanaerobaculia bacterium]
MDTKELHEIRDPVHTFIRLVTAERDLVLNSRPVQRLRHIHQLAMTKLVYPAATHKRFEHSLGVMEVATRIFDVVTKKVDEPSARRIVPVDDDELRYWRRTLRAAALCHDIGHLPFSHAAEDELLPVGWDHESITAELIRSDEMRSLWSNLRGPLDPEDIVKLAVGPKKAGVELDDWETLLAEMIVGDSFGADFLAAWLEEGQFPISSEGHLSMTDHEIYSEILRAAEDAGHSGHAPARRIVKRGHFREVYRRNAADIDRCSDAPARIAAALKDRFGSEAIVHDSNSKRKSKGSGGVQSTEDLDEDFPVRLPDGRVVSAYGQSEVLKTIPPVAVDFVFVEPRIREEALRWLDENRDKIIRADNDGEEEATDGDV